MTETANNCKSTEAGNAFIYVMMGVVLFAALMFVFTRSARQGGIDISDKQAGLIAIDIIEYGKAVEGGVQRLLRKGISETDISFETDVVPSYANASCGTDSCKVFAQGGGGIAARNIPQNTNGGTSGLATWYFNKRMSIDGVSDGSASDDNDLTMAIEVSPTICRKINEIIFHTAPDLAFVADTPMLIEKFDGDYAVTGGFGEVCDGVTAMSTWCRGKAAFCGKYTAGNSGMSSPGYVFIQMLIPR